jgi:hypothetical protein
MFVLPIDTPPINGLGSSTACTVSARSCVMMKCWEEVGGINNLFYWNELHVISHTYSIILIVTLCSLVNGSYIYVVRK